jgi:hypothetical protein
VEDEVGAVCAVCRPGGGLVPVDNGPTLLEYLFLGRAVGCDNHTWCNVLLDPWRPMKAKPVAFYRCGIDWLLLSATVVASGWTCMPFQACPLVLVH